MTDQYIERVENLIRVVGSVRDEDFNLYKWCDCAIGHAIKDPYFKAWEFDPMLSYLVGVSFMGEIAEFFGISKDRAGKIFLPNIGTNYKTRQDVLMALRVLLLEKMAQQIDNCVKPLGEHLASVAASLNPPHIEELADAA
jgi:hypothetical protein